MRLFISLIFLLFSTGIFAQERSAAEWQVLIGYLTPGDLQVDLTEHLSRDPFGGYRRIDDYSKGGYHLRVQYHTVNSGPWNGYFSGFVGNVQFEPRVRRAIGNIIDGYEDYPIMDPINFFHLGVATGLRYQKDFGNHSFNISAGYQYTLIIDDTPRGAELRNVYTDDQSNHTVRTNFRMQNSSQGMLIPELGCGISLWKDKPFGIIFDIRTHLGSNLDLFSGDFDYQIERLSDNAIFSEAGTLDYRFKNTAVSVGLVYRVFKDK